MKRAQKTDSVLGEEEEEEEEKHVDQSIRNCTLIRGSKALWLSSSSSSSLGSGSNECYDLFLQMPIVDFSKMS